MFAIRHLPTKGLAVIATTPIQPGTRLLAEQPLISIPTNSPASSLFTAIRHLTPTQIQTLTNLSPSPAKSSALLSTATALFHALHSLLHPSSPSHLQTPLPFLTTLTHYPTLRAIFRNNNFLLTPSPYPSSSSSSSTTAQPPHQALFPLTSHFNHACVPNAQTNWNAALQRFTTHAVTAVAAGDELCLSYLPVEGFLGAEERRARLMAGYGFRCACEACVDAGGMEGVRGRWRERLRGFAAAGEGEGEGELGLTVEFARVYETLGVRGREVASVYLRVAELAKAVGDEERFEEYAEKGLRADEECLGKDNPVYRESVKRMRALRGGGG